MSIFLFWHKIPVVLLLLCFLFIHATAAWVKTSYLMLITMCLWGKNDFWFCLLKHNSLYFSWAELILFWHCWAFSLEKWCSMISKLHLFCEPTTEVVVIYNGGCGRWRNFLVPRLWLLEQYFNLRNLIPQPYPNDESDKHNVLISVWKLFGCY